MILYQIILFTMILGHLSRASYSKYVGQVITPEVLHKFMCANEAKLILDYLKTNDRQLRKLNN